MGKKKRSASGKPQAAKSGQGTSTQKEILNQVKSPEPFNFQEPATWTPWIKRYKMFHSAIGLASAPEDQQINMLLYCMGVEAEELLSSLGITEKEKTSFDTVVATFEEYFLKNNKIFYHRALFLLRDQKPGEDVDSYITALNEMAEKCDWSCKSCKSKEFKGEMILLKLINGINDNNKPSKYLQLRETITLTDVLRQLKQCETTDGQNSNFDEKDNLTAVMAVRQKPRALGTRDEKLKLSVGECNSNDVPSSHQLEDNAPVGFQPKFISREVKGSMRSSFSSGVDTGDEYTPIDEQPAIRYASSTEDWQRRYHNVGVVMQNKPSTGSIYENQQLTVNSGKKCGCKAGICPHVKGPTFLEDKYLIDFPPLSTPCKEFKFPPKRESALTTKRKVVTQASVQYEHYDSSDDDSNSNEGYGFLDYLRKFHPQEYLDFISDNTWNPMKTTPEVDDKPKPSENYHFSVSGHKSRRSLRNLCQQRLKDLTY